MTDQDKSGGLWRHRDFMLLWSGQTVSEMGSAVTQLALPLTAVVILKASTLDVGLLTAAATLAFAVIALPAGALADAIAAFSRLVADLGDHLDAFDVNPLICSPSGVLAVDALALPSRPRPARSRVPQDDEGR